MSLICIDFHRGTLSRTARLDFGFLIQTEIHLVGAAVVNVMNNPLTESTVQYIDMIL